MIDDVDVDDDNASNGDAIPCLALRRHIGEDGRSYVELFPVHLPAHCHCAFLQILDNAATGKGKEW